MLDKRIGNLDSRLGVESSRTDAATSVTAMWSYAVDLSSQLEDWDMSTDGGEKDDALAVARVVVMPVSNRRKSGIESFLVNGRDWRLDVEDESCLLEVEVPGEYLSQIREHRLLPRVERPDDSS